MKFYVEYLYYYNASSGGKKTKYWIEVPESSDTMCSKCVGCFMNQMEG